MSFAAVQDKSDFLFNDYLDIVPKGTKIPLLRDFEALLRDEYTIGYITAVTNSIYVLNDKICRTKQSD